MYSTPQHAKVRGDLSAHISWLLNYTLAYPRPTEASITLAHEVIPSTKNPLFSSHPYLQRLFLELSVDETPAKG